MAFRVAARALVQLGAELISSDGVALYELVRNAFDARSPRVDIDVVVRLPDAVRQSIHEAFTLATKSRGLQPEFAEMKVSAEREVDPVAPGASELVAQFRAAESWEDLLSTADRANYIAVNDTGRGMSFEHLATIFLTVGTPAKIREREESITEGRSSSDTRILGEKGIGRLSAMRLGRFFRVETTREYDSMWSVLDIDWGLFTESLDTYLEDIEIAPEPGRRKAKGESSGTRIHIAGLTSMWTKDRLRTRNVSTRLRQQA